MRWFCGSVVLWFCGSVVLWVVGGGLTFVPEPHIHALGDMFE